MKNLLFSFLVCMTVSSAFALDVTGLRTEDYHNPVGIDKSNVHFSWQLQSELRGVMLRRWFLDYLAAWQTLILNRNWGDFRAIYQARHAYKKWRHDFDADRQTICAEVSIPQRKSYSILWQYYFHQRKKYSCLVDKKMS